MERRAFLPLVLESGAAFVAGGPVFASKATSNTVGSDILRDARDAGIVTSRAGDSLLYGPKATEP